MSSSALVPPGEYVQREIIYETERTRITRTARPDGAGALIRKEHRGPGAWERTQHELRILSRLAGVPGVVQLAGGGVDELVMEDVDGRSLAEVIADGGLDHRALLEFAVELARIVGAVHRHAVVHSDINPANVLVVEGPDPADVPRPVLIDFHLATTFVERVPGFSHHREIVGTLPYLAPEQTGRTGMAVDDRADLYGLGSTLYQLSTGEPPFDVVDPLRMIHDTLTRVPVPPAERDARVPRQLSDIVMRLLEKEPDRRYQSAEGVVHDLSRLLATLTAGRPESFALGQRDFPRRLSAPSRLVGRDREAAALRTAFEAALDGGGRGVLVAGAPGVGKTVLVNGLRSVVTERGGWFVTGKFDQYRQGAEAGAVTQALRALGRLLLAGDNSEVADVRDRIVDAVGVNLPLLSGLPEFVALLGVHGFDPPDGEPPTDRAGQVGGDEAPTAGDPREITARLQQVVLGVLGAVVSGQRPVVMVIDDMQWAGPASIAMIDGILTDERLAGVLLIGAYRDGEVTETHPLTAAMAKWDDLGATPTVLRLNNLPADDLGDLLGEMLRLPASEAGDLAVAVGARTGGNPFDTVELVNALRHVGALVVGDTGWTWDATTIRRFVGQGDVIDLLSARIDRLDEDPRSMVDLMACLGGQVPVDLLCAASARSVATVTEHLIAPLEDGLLVLEQDDAPVVRFRHDRVQQAAHARMGADRRHALHLEIARRLAGTSGYATLAAEQYLHCVDVLVGAPEARTVAALFVGAATGVRIVNPLAADRFLTAATALLADPPDDPLAREAQRQHHAVLYGLGRLVEADAVYAVIERRCVAPTDLVEPACVQIASLTNRAQFREAVSLGLQLLARLGVVEVPDDFAAVITHQYGELAAWSNKLDLATDLSRPEPGQGPVRMTATLIDAMVSPTNFCDVTIAAWLTLTSQRLWVEHGPSAPLVANLSTAIGTTLMLGQDFRAGYLIVKHALAVGEARGYEPATSVARNLLSLGVQHWFEPLEEGVRQSRRAREGLIRAGNLQGACFTQFGSLPLLLDAAPSMDACAADAESGLAFAARTGNAMATAVSVAYRQLLRALRGETTRPGSFDDADFAEAEYLAAHGDNVLAAHYFHVCRAVGAALFGDVAVLIRHATQAAALAKFNVALYVTALSHLLHGLALLHRLRAADTDERPVLLAELDGCQQWLAERAVDAPGNFGHLSTLLAAECAWAQDDKWAAAEAFDAARRQVATRSRSWHQALITERSAAFHLAVGLHQAGRDQMAEARHLYAEWSATAKVAQLDRDHPFLVAPAGRQAAGRTVSAHPSVHMSSQELDLLAILRSSQALSSETSPDALRDRVGEVLSAMTGATSVLIVMRNGSDEWLLWDTTGGTAQGTPLADAAALAPLSAFRYAERTGEPLLVPDAGVDERFARDPYLHDLERCSLLVVPMLSNGVLRGVLLLTNRHRAGAFSVDGLEAVLLVAGQLTVSFDNAQLYASLERKVQERTKALERANVSLEALSNTDALTGLPNRRHFDATLQAQWRLAEAQGTPLGLAMIDVDSFKLYNDRYGHVAGDECLRLVAGALGSALRDRVDVACRYGGEEFAIILPGADEIGSAQVAERVRAAVAALHHPHAATALGHVSISVGVAAYNPAASGGRALAAPGDLVTTADLGLYAAKEEGRNRVRTAGRA